MKQYVQDWMRLKYSKIFQIKGKSERESLITAMTQEEKVYSNNLHNFVVDRLKVVAISDGLKRSYA